MSDVRPADLSEPEGASIHRVWLSYMDEVIPAAAPAEQIAECKRAFVAGAKAVLAIVTRLGDDEFSEDEGVLVLMALHRECQAFVQDVLEGRA